MNNSVKFWGGSGYLSSYFTSTVRNL